MNPEKPDEWIVDVALLDAGLRTIIPRSVRRSDPVRAIEAVSLKDLVTQFESLGDNCEFGLVQRVGDSEPLGLLRFASFQVGSYQRIQKLIAAIEPGFDGLGKDGAIQISAEGPNREFMVRETRYGLLYHTFRHEGESGTERIQQSEAARLDFLRRKFISDLATGEKIWMWRSYATTQIEQIMPLLESLRRRGPNTLLWVIEAHGDHQPGSVERLGEGLLIGYVERFAPPDNATDIEPGSWFEVCKAALVLAGRTKLPSCFPILDDGGLSWKKALAPKTIAGSPRGAFSGGLRSYVRSEVQPRSTPDQLRAKGHYFLRDATKADDDELRNQFRSLSYIHFEAADEVALSAAAVD